MKPFFESRFGKIYYGNCEDVLPSLGLFSAMITDPPYGLGFMGKKWDYQVPSVEQWRACLDSLLPGAFLLSFAGTRTQHRMCCNIEDAGFEIRDMIAWVYGSGFPKSLNISKALDKAAGAERKAVPVGAPVKRMIPGADQNKTGSWIKDNGRAYQPCVEIPSSDEARQWDGWGTALKPAIEPITLARKPFKGTVAANILKHGVGGLNIDECRVALNGDYKCKANGRPSQTGLGDNYDPLEGNKPDTIGRYPANLIHDGSAEVVGLFPNSKSTGGINSGKLGKKIYGKFKNETIGQNAGGLGDSGSAARFFYCAKASRRERGEGNTHPTVKPTRLIEYLIKLVTPPGGIVVDPFGGSGTTALVCERLGIPWVLIEKEEPFCEISANRLSEDVAA